MHLPVILERPFRHLRGKCWLAQYPAELAWAADTNERPTVCPVVLWEDDLALGPAHSLHTQIASKGSGCYSVCHDGWLYFSTSDNIDPNTNDRAYRLDLSDALPTVKPSPAVAELIKAARMLPEDFAPSQAFAALRRCLEVLYPSRILEFHATKSIGVLSELDVVTRRYRGYLQEITNSDVMFLSIMCSGRTWVRYFLQTYLERVTGTGLSLAQRSMPRTSASPSICFTHDFLDMFETTRVAPWIVFEALLRERPLILLTRDLRDLGVSYYHHLRSSQPKVFSELVPSGSISDFINSPVVGLERLAEIQELQLEFFDTHPGRKIHLRYENLHTSSRAEFERLLNFLSEAPIASGPLEQALENSRFGEMQAFEIKISLQGKAKEYVRLGVDNWSGDTNDLKVRAGIVGRFREFLPELEDQNTLAARYPITSRVVAKSIRRTKFDHLYNRLRRALS